MKRYNLLTFNELSLGLISKLVFNYLTRMTFILLCIQVATALLVAGSTLTFWIPWQTSFESTSSYSSIIEIARLLV